MATKVDDLRLSVRSDPRLLGSIRGLVRGWLAAFDLGRERSDEVVLAIDEACSNAIRHSYGGRCDRVVELNLRSTQEHLELEVCDHGDPCPPERLKRRALRPPSPEELRPGGLGLQLIYLVFDEVEFRSGEDRGNRVIMRLRRPAAGGD